MAEIRRCRSWQPPGSLSEEGGDQIVPVSVVINGCPGSKQPSPVDFRAAEQAAVDWPEERPDLLREAGELLDEAQP